MPSRGVLCTTTGRLLGLLHGGDDVACGGSGGSDDDDGDDDDGGGDSNKKDSYDGPCSCVVVSRRAYSAVTGRFQGLSFQPTDWKQSVPGVQVYRGHFCSTVMIGSNVCQVCRYTVVISVPQ